jgi:hypothetical protein
VNSRFVPLKSLVKSAACGYVTDDDSPNPEDDLPAFSVPVLVAVEP